MLLPEGKRFLFLMKKNQREACQALQEAQIFLRIIFKKMTSFCTECMISSEKDKVINSVDIDMHSSLPSSSFL